MKKFRSVLLAIIVLLSPFRSRAELSRIEWISNTVAFGIPLTAYAIAHFKEDKEGKRQWVSNTMAEVFVNSTARVFFDQTDLGERPNGKRFGFPSGHMGFVTSGTAFLQQRYGWKYGLPAFLLSGYVAYERSYTDHHHWRDLIAGAVLAYGVALMIVTREGETQTLQVTPTIGSDFAGLSLQWRW